LPWQHSYSDGDLFSSVTLSESRGNSILHAPSTSIHDFIEGDTFPHDLAFGDYISKLKEDHIFRVGFGNIGGFPLMPSLNAKAQDIKHFMALYDLDIFGGCESNFNWSKAPDSMRLQEWFRDVPSCRSFSAHNIREKAGLKQYGGTFWICTGLASRYLFSSSKDPSGLGRWVVCSLSGLAG